jgi:hypothetical protein
MPYGRRGYTLLKAGVLVTAAGFLIAVHDAAGAVITGAWQNTSLELFLGPLPGDEPQDPDGLGGILWSQPLWLFVAVPGMFMAMLGWLLMSDHH